MSILKHLFLVLVITCLCWSALNAQSSPRVYYAIKPDPKTASLCDGTDGLEKVWAAEPVWTQRDLKAQYDGWKMQADYAANHPAEAANAGAPPIGTPPASFEDFRQAYLISKCDLAHRGQVETFERAVPYFGYSSWTCDVNSNQDCDENRTIRAWPGYQICGISWHDGPRRGKEKGFIIEPQSFLPDGPDHTGRFRQLAVKLWAHGSGSTSGVGAKIRIENFLVTIIPDDWPDAPRVKLGCKMGAHPVPPPPMPKPPETPVPNVESIFSDTTADGGHSYQFQFYNPSTSPSRMAYVVERRDEGSDKWIEIKRDFVEIKPGTTEISEGFHWWAATEWRTLYLLVQ